MKIFGLTPLSTWDRASNLMQILEQSNKNNNKNAKIGYQNIAPQTEIRSIVENRSAKTLPLAKSINKFMSKFSKLGKV